MQEIQTDAIVIGSGPGGYVAAIRLAQLGKKVICVEKESPGGVCLNVGCIPSKALITAAKTYEKAQHADAMGIFIDGARVDMAKLQAWKQEVVKKHTNGVVQLVKGAKAQLMMGTATVVGPNRVEVVTKEGPVGVTAQSIVLATGSRPIPIPGFDIDNEKILDSTGALAQSALPKRLVVVGGGYIGIELGMCYAKLGSQVTVVEFTAGILPGNDAECVQLVARKMKKLGIETLLETKAKGWREEAGTIRVTVETKAGDKTIDCDKVLVTVGRKPNSDGLGLDKVGVEIDKRGFIVVDKKLRTKVPSIYAIGDVAGQPMLAHKASKEADVVAEVIAGKQAEMDTTVIPAVIFSDPEIASVGMTQEQAEKAGHKVRIGKFPYAGLGRATTQMETDGFMKIVADAETEQVLGVHIVGYGASDLISEGTLALEMGAYLQDIALTVHPHPTMGEGMMEAAKAALGESPHIVGGGMRR